MYLWPNFNRMTRMLWMALGLLILASCGQEAARKGNHLIHETSPYLLQHAYNPVDWHPWNDKVLAKAAKEDKLLLISIGYAACHWCHVMEHESFEDTAIARIMNEHFINIKVDREERPDVDNVYMSACQLASDRGCGWPLNAFALPDGRPIWVGTYFPKKEWEKILTYFVDVYQNDRENLEQYANDLAAAIRSSDQVLRRDGEPDFQTETLDVAARDMLASIDLVFGGRKGAPKFPIPNNYEFLLRYHATTQHEPAWEAVERTLDNLSRGGIYDHLGGGFARYTVDEAWRIPHFEKMLYDNGQLVSLFSQAYRHRADERWKYLVYQTLDFIERELSDANTGGFYSSLDADTEGEEGRFYVWKKQELDSLLGNDAPLFGRVYSIEANGNWEHGNNILYRTKSMEQLAQELNLPESELLAKLRSLEWKLFEARSKRVRPALDDKILCSWNALMLQGYVDAYKAFGEDAWLERARKNGNFIREAFLQKDGRLNRNHKGGQSTINAFLDDYALTIQAFIALYEVTFDRSWLDVAEQLTRYVLEHFEEESSGLFRFTSSLDPPLLTNSLELSDNVIPASNSVMARNLYRLGTLLYQEELIGHAQSMLHTVWPGIEEQNTPSFFSNWCNLYLDITYPTYEIAITGPEALTLAANMHRHYLPNALVLGGVNENGMELLKGKIQEDRTMVYVCFNKVCKLPVQTIEAALEQLAAF
jgi:uncharacterized protein YyaL (SSP411 family)